jgi:hypothetical protein
MSVPLWLLLCIPFSGLAAQGQRAVLLRTDRTMADSSWSAGFRATVAAGALPDAILLWPGAPVVKGLPAIGRLLESENLKATWQPIGAEVSSDSTMGVTWGVTAAPPSGTSGPVIGRYIATWQRDPGIGPWRLAAMLFTELTGDGSAPAASGLPVELPPIQSSGKVAPFVAADLAFARLAGDSGAGIAFERWAAPDAHMFAGGGILVEGPKAIGRVMSAPATWKWHPVAAGASDDGSMGWTIGEAVITAADGHAGPSKYLTIWQRQPDGAIRFLTDGGNGRPVR